LLDDPAAPPPRFTVDVDAVVDVITYAQWEELQRRLHECGLVVRADAPIGRGRICLFHLDQIEVDIMPARMPIIIRPSRMLELGFQFAEPHEDFSLQAERCGSRAGLRAENFDNDRRARLSSAGH